MAAVVPLLPLAHVAEALTQAVPAELAKFVLPLGVEVLAHAAQFASVHALLIVLQALQVLPTNAGVVGVQTVQSPTVHAVVPLMVLLHEAEAATQAVPAPLA